MKADDSLDEGKYELVNSIDVIFVPKPWATPEVRVLRDSLGAPLAFVSIAAVNINREGRNGLPTEFFNHQLFELDYQDPDKLAGFMSEYGVLGASDPLPGNALLFRKAIEQLRPSDRESIVSFEESTGYMAAGYPFGLLFGEGRQDAFAHYWKLRESFLDIDNKLKMAQPEANILTEKRIRAIVSCKSAVRAYEDWLYCVRHIRAMVRYKTVPELANELGEDELSVIRCCRGARNILQRRLKNVSPRLDILDVADGTYLMNDECREPGCFEDALALQIWNFVLEAQGGYTICKECGKVFVHKQNKGRKGKSRTTSLFCCDKCKNRFSQREYRKSDGYRLKAEKRDG